MEHSPRKGKWRRSDWSLRACHVPERSVYWGSILSAAAAASVQQGWGNIPWRLFQSKVLQSEARRKSQRKTSVIIIPMQLKLGLAPRARGAGSTPKGCPEITAPAFWKLSVDKDVRVLPSFRNWPSRWAQVSKVPKQGVPDCQRLQRMCWSAQHTPSRSTLSASEQGPFWEAVCWFLLVVPKPQIICASETSFFFLRNDQGDERPTRGQSSIAVLQCWPLNACSLCNTQCVTKYPQRHGKKNGKNTQIVREPGSCQRPGCWIIN